MPRPVGLPKTGGRQVGTPNKVTASVKAAFAQAFDEMGGAQALVTWGKDNPTDFYKLASKLIPLDVQQSGGISLNITTGVPRASTDD